MKNFKKMFSLEVALCLLVLTSIAVALVSYQAQIGLTPFQQFSVGTTTGSWTVYVNQVDIPCYLPGGTTQPTLDTGNTSTYAFKAVTDANQVMALKIELDTPADNTVFSKFDITVLGWSGSSWEPVTLYSASTGATTKSSINALNPSDVGYVHHTTSTTKYYLIQATYSYDISDSTAASGITLKYTPLPQNSFS